MSHVTLGLRPRQLAAWLATAITAALLTVVGTSAPAHASASCGWTVEFSPAKVNALFPDQFATYWLGALPLPPGGHLEIHGQYPYARYMSFTTYTYQTSAIDGIPDVAIAPDKGSTNPFLAGANRLAKQRNYTVNIVNAKKPASGRVGNTVYLSDPSGAHSMTSTGLAIFVLRIYVPNRGLSNTGGVPLPSLSVVTSTGQKVAIPNCPNLIPDNPLTKILSTANGIASPIALAPATPIWHRFVNLETTEIQSNLENPYTAPLSSLLSNITATKLPTGGFFENPDNKYVSATIDQKYGKVLVLRASAPTTPQTHDGEAAMGTGQLRYWSMCSENLQTTMFFGCVYDEGVPVSGPNRRYTIVVSTPANRPANATAACGVAWMPAGPFSQSLLILRNMLPSPGFAQAVQNVTPGHEKEQMGKYYPVGQYYANKAAFEKLGCQR